MNNPNSTQVGGKHYQSTYQHWDLVLETGMGYLEGCATKYIARWRKKGGVADLEKAKHYVQKLEKDVQTRSIIPPDKFVFLQRITNYFCEVNKLDEAETEIVKGLVLWNDSRELSCWLHQIDRLIEQNTFDTGEPGAGYVNQD